MSQKNKGIYRLISIAFFYSLIQRIISATSFREKIIKKYITKHNVNVKVLDVGCGPAEILIVLRNVLEQLINVTSSIPISTDFSINHSKRS